MVFFQMYSFNSKRLFRVTSKKTQFREEPTHHYVKKNFKRTPPLWFWGKENKRDKNAEGLFKTC